MANASLFISWEVLGSTITILGTFLELNIPCQGSKICMTARLDRRTSRPVGSFKVIIYAETSGHNDLTFDNWTFNKSLIVLPVEGDKHAWRKHGLSAAAAAAAAEKP